MLNEVQLERFWGRVDKSGDCWEWTAAKHEHGYGLFSVKGKMERVHRISYKLHIGKIPNGLFVCHKCDNRACMKPDHLFVGTQKDNIRDCIQKGRFLRGEDSAKSILTEQEVREIRKKYALGGITYEQLGKEYGVSDTGCIYHVIKRNSWRHVEEMI